MKNLKTRYEFINEEINWKKGLAGVALAGSLLGLPSCNYSGTKNIPLETEYVEMHRLSRPILDYMTKNYEMWERYVISDSNKTKNGHLKNNLHDYMFKKLKEEFDEKGMEPYKTDNLKNVVFVSTLNNNYWKYWEYYNYYLKR